MGGGHGKGWQNQRKGQGRGPPRSHEQIQHARSVNSKRSSLSLPNKSVGRSQRRSAAYHAAQSSTPAKSIGEPQDAPPSRRSQSSVDGTLFGWTEISGPVPETLV